ncbi:bifunctional glutamate N-acetyltransferase/amino-acid acetyltransferase ArgJ [Helicobacter mustelae]|uniref:Arginine biosynthesis bifunctional protein ArgJ n=1 Tax=Helicobacter mustelae (strain ATCC 43772 / CCUG 25715 / CIP 103759 / LMG 18044 / NCTC 12198 / R85-136P) TaxID=679897 RepID=D3UJH7_HELM1|nr:bifunctional glutamate N-acetyltransferase/amino-acid acetyltransferase ArgJ [Helicobacter mustelae]CBG40653.1 putative arginine biosynthesis bifunctional protein [Helicobacter mustelae 12198]SQH72150.1 arginine biosynthesis bifunctional protein [Helicobacter mustelae]STP13295.1 arginine biosynthesis bifunctional protein [Helicobacter mustelae]
MEYKIFPIKGGVCAPRGFLADGYCAGLGKLDKEGRAALDVGYIYMQIPCCVYALFTQNAFKAAPILHFLENVSGKKSNFVLINTKNANAMTGKRGLEDVYEILSALQKKFPQIQNPIMSSTGVIGYHLPKEKILSSFDQIYLEKRDESGHERAATAIMTTDRYAKEIAFEVIDSLGKKFRIGAMAKGAGMIQPSMATMLCYITTDARLNNAQSLLERAVKKTFNTISVDGDMSTNDSVMLFCSEDVEVQEEIFEEVLVMALEKLAKDIVRDGEGSTKLVGFKINSAWSDAEAERAAKALSNSLLVKTAIFGGDPNWGRIASTIGASGVKCDANLLKIRIGGVLVYDCGEIYFDKETEARAGKKMQQESFLIECDLGMGEGSYLAYGCDLGYEYVKINADYRS